jgi:hypothetical protein
MAKPIEPIPNSAECERVMTAYPAGVLVMCLGSEPYAVPMNHAFVDGVLYFHCAPTGRKLDIIRANPSACYVVNDRFGERPTLADSRQCHGNWESVIAYGGARVIEDRDELRRVFDVFGKYFNPDFTVSEDSLDTTAAIILEVDTMTARRETEDRTVSFWSWSRS